MTRGTLFLVTGASGSGKDSIIEAARQALGGDSAFDFPRRYVTRPGAAAGEDYVPVSPEAFREMDGRGDFVLTWEAHGLAYGVPSSIEESLAEGRSVIVNVSRTVIDTARRHYSPVRVLVIHAPPEVLAERLRRRGRESAAEIAERLRGAAVPPPEGDDVTVIDNSGPLADAVERFLGALKEARPVPAG